MSSDDVKAWVKRRIEAVNEVYSTFRALTDAGIELHDENTDLQIPCPLPGHGPDANPSSRFYGGSKQHFHCFKCKKHLSGIGLFSEIRRIKFMEGLRELEIRFNIKVERNFNFDANLLITQDRSRSDFKSSRWDNIETLMSLVETKLLRTKQKCEFIDYVKICKILDNVAYDYEKTQQTTVDMFIVLNKAVIMLDRICSEHDAVISLNFDLHVS